MNDNETATVELEFDLMRQRAHPPTTLGIHILAA